MKIGFVVNDIATERPDYATVHLAMAATNRGHQACLFGRGHFGYEPDGGLRAHAWSAKNKKYRSTERYLDDLRRAGSDGHVDIDKFDVVMLRADPAHDALSGTWATHTGLAFGQLLADAGVLVVNDPTSLASAVSKAYFQHFPEAVRPKTLISREEPRIAEFVDELGGKAVLKPLQGSGGSGVFMVNSKESPNLAQIIEAIARDGYVVAQEYLPEAKNGDVRMMVMNGQPLEVSGRIAALRRRPSSSDIRSNLAAGGKAEPVDITQEMLDVVDAVRPKLVADGMFLVGLDIVGDKLMEVNVFSPGGLNYCDDLYGVHYSPAVLADLERKVALRSHYSDQLPNNVLATM